MPGAYHGSHMKVFYSDVFVAAGEEFDTTRKAAWIAESLGARAIAGTELVEPAPLVAAQLEVVHAPAYVRAVQTGEPRSLAESNGFRWDAGLWTAVCASNGGVVEAALHAAKTGSHAGALSSGLHHARHATGGGFCTFNGIALAVRTVMGLEREHSRRILILDLDAHCGGGTYSLVRDIPGVVQADISVCKTDFYQPGSGSSSTLEIIALAADYLPTLAARLDALAGEPFDLLIYNAGMDPHEDSAIGGLKGITTAVIAERERLVFDWAQRNHVGVAFTLAGGYTGGRLDQAGLVQLHRLTIGAAIQRD